ncbi:hypothetical protein A2982_03835 [candidate division WWE3 bacterium RIFCSPLOWO2_01_FULL_39_13]|uniref:Uncharacterized protein n=1 Tax=candidate division WWE3 bacterium RIFCSPLOWO2_01_FULL_39_13 TaxID=1802624 RepID=A0A1F4V3R3_UNCKA|nr:MAG: hypothetical protein A2982_03835 [candidate division WWE3 bacterium RIFCSPLOWO2_01_FULL_39_13]
MIIIKNSLYKFALVIAVFVVASIIIFLCRSYLIGNRLPGNNQTIQIGNIKTLDGFLLGSVDNNQAPQTIGLFPCARDETEVLTLINQFLSYNKCHKDNLQSGCANNVTEIIPQETINREFQISKDTYLFRINKLTNKYDYYMQGSNNPNYIITPPTSFYVCNSNYFSYINTSYADKQQGSVFYPFNIEESVISGSHRLILEDYLHDGRLGTTKIAVNQPIDESSVRGLMDFLYTIRVFSLGGFNSKASISNREVTESNTEWVVKDTVAWKVFNDTPPYQTTRYTEEYKIVVNKDTSVVLASID